jgi:hypothetical protein
MVVAMVDEYSLETLLSSGVQTVRLGIILENRELEVLLLRRKGSDKYELPTGPLESLRSLKDSIKGILQGLSLSLDEIHESLKPYIREEVGLGHIVYEISTRGQDIYLDKKVYERYLWVDPEIPPMYLDEELRSYLMSIA